jgi:hypothetical protein
VNFTGERLLFPFQSVAARKLQVQIKIDSDSFLNRVVTVGIPNEFFPELLLQIVKKTFKY